MVGVVIPAYNAARFVGDTIASIRAQIHTAWQCVVVDDGSTDTTLDVARTAAHDDPRITVVTQPNRGPSAARNHGFGLLDGTVDLVSFMDADDVWNPDALAVLLDAMDANPTAIGAHGLADFIDETGQPLQTGLFADQGRRRVSARGGWPRPCPLDQPTTFEHVNTQTVPFPPGVIVARAEVYRRAGLWDERICGAEDWDVLVRVLRFGDLAFANRVILGYRRHDSNLSTTTLVVDAFARARAMTFVSSANTPAHRTMLRDAWRARQIIDARNRWSACLDALRRRDARITITNAVRLPMLPIRWVSGRPRRFLDRGVAR